MLIMNTIYLCSDLVYRNPTTPKVSQSYQGVWFPTVRAVKRPFASAWFVLMVPKTVRVARVEKNWTPSSIALI